MKTLYWDAVDENGHPYTWDNPNLRWGDPSYILEPGDPGYTPPSASPTPTKSKRTRTMKHQRSYPDR